MNPEKPTVSVTVFVPTQADRSTVLGALAESQHSDLKCCYSDCSRCKN